MNHIDEIWCSDLVEMQQFNEWNKGFRYLLMALDILSKYGWIVPLKDNQRLLEPPHGMMELRDDLFENALKGNLVSHFI